MPHPDRIFFDLYGTKLAPELVGKSFEVDAGFLHKIRVAQYKLGMARVVLDVDDVAEYSAFLLPNPYRLIIDIHGKLPPNKLAKNKEPKNSAAGNQSQSRLRRQPSTADDNSGQDVTVTSVKPSDDKSTPSKATGSQSADVQSADAGKSVPIKGHGKDKDKDKERVVPQTPAETAKVITPKIAVDESAIDDSGRAAGEPTSGPTFESIAPKESSRNKKTQR